MPDSAIRERRVLCDAWEFGELPNSMARQCATGLPVHADVVGAQRAGAPDDLIESHVPTCEPELAIERVRPTRR